MVELTRLSDRRHTIGEDLATNTDANQRALLRAEDDHLAHRHRQLRDQLAVERDPLRSPASRESDAARSLQHAVDQRRATVTHDTFTRPPAWLTSWLTELAGNGTLDRLPDETLHAAIADIAHHRDRWNISTLEPLGPTPDVGHPRFNEWQQLHRLAQPELTADLPAPGALGRS